MNITSDNKKILLVSDIHHHWRKLDKIIKAEGADIVVCLSDWFDSYDYDTEQDAIETAHYYCQFLESPNHYDLMGNHMHYVLPFNGDLLCSGYEHSKREAIQDVLKKNKFDWRKRLQFHIYVDDFLCSHAGLHKSWIPPFTTNIDKWLEEETIKCEIKISSQQTHWFWQAGIARGGTVPFGGLTWLDARNEFAPIEGIKQIMGHTNNPRGKVYLPYGEDNHISQANNLCIDCNLNQWVTITNGKLEIKRYKDL